MRRFVVPILALALLLTGASTAQAASGWSLTLSPMTVNEGQRTVFALRATDTDGSGDIACVVIIVPASFTVHAAAVTGTSVDGSWAATRAPDVSGKTRVEVFNPGGGAKLKEDDWVAFTITATGVDAGSNQWSARVTQGEDCDGASFLAPIHHSVAVEPAATPPPTPAPTPAPTAAPTPPPTPAPTAAPTPAPTGAPTPPPTAAPTPRVTPRPTAVPPQPASTPSPTPTPGGATPTATAEPTATPAASIPGATRGPQPSTAVSAATASPGIAAVPVGGSGGSDPGTPGSGGPLPPPIAVSLSGQLETSGFAAMSLLGDGYTWFVPAFVAGVPGLLIVLIVLVQLLGGIIWTPSIRRLRSDPAKSAEVRPSARP